MNEVKKVDNVDRLVLALAKTLAVLAFLTLLSTIFSCTSKDLECTSILDKGIVNGKYIIKTEISHFPVQKKTYDFYSIGDTFCE